MIRDKNVKSRKGERKSIKGEVIDLMIVSAKRNHLSELQRHPIRGRENQVEKEAWIADDCDSVVASTGGTGLRGSDTATLKGEDGTDVLLTT